MSVSPEYYRRAASSPPKNKKYHQRTTKETTTCYCTPKGAGISYLADTPTCPPAPRKPRPPPACRKLLFDAIMVRFVDLEGILRPATGPSKYEKPRHPDQSDPASE
jgi:hypothetical protein